MALYHLTNATYQPVWRDISKKKYFEIRKSVGRKILESEINSPKYKYIFFTRRWIESCALFSSFEIRNPTLLPSSNRNILETSFFFPFPLFVPCFLRSKTHRNRGVAGFSEKSLSRVSLLPTGIIFPRNDKSTVERSLRLEVDLDRIFDFSSAAKPRTLINACRVDSKNVFDYLNIFFLRCFRVVRTQW